MITLTKGLGLTLALGTLAACGNTDLERGLTGALAGGAAAQATGNDPGTGALVGATAGVFCDDAGICQ